MLTPCLRSTVPNSTPTPLPCPDTPPTHTFTCPPGVSHTCTSHTRRQSFVPTLSVTYVLTGVHTCTHEHGLTCAHVHTTDTHVHTTDTHTYTQHTHVHTTDTHVHNRHTYAHTTDPHVCPHVNPHTHARTGEVRTLDWVLSTEVI